MRSLGNHRNMKVNNISARRQAVSRQTWAINFVFEDFFTHFLARDILAECEPCCRLSVPLNRVPRDGYLICYCRWRRLLLEAVLLFAHSKLNNKSVYTEPQEDLQDA